MFDSDLSVEIHPTILDNMSEIEKLSELIVFSLDTYRRDNNQ